MKKTDPLMGAKLKSKTHLLNTFFFSRFSRVWLQSFQKVLKWHKFFFQSKKILKNAEFYADFESVENVVKNAHKKVISKVWWTWVKLKKGHISVRFLQITFFGAFWQNFFNWFKISVNSAFFDTHTEFLNKNIFLLF